MIAKPVARRCDDKRAKILRRGCATSQQVGADRCAIYRRRQCEHLAMSRPPHRRPAASRDGRHGVRWARIPCLFIAMAHYMPMIRSAMRRNEDGGLLGQQQGYAEVYSARSSSNLSIRADKYACHTMTWMARREGRAALTNWSLGQRCHRHRGAMILSLTPHAATPKFQNRYAGAAGAAVIATAAR